IVPDKNYLSPLMVSLGELGLDYEEASVATFALSSTNRAAIVGSSAVRNVLALFGVNVQFIKKYSDFFSFNLNSKKGDMYD
ncbi:MAG: hypothetical protein DRJ35_06380, partial [Thermoprotei archaeon]